MNFIKITTDRQLESLESLAREIWADHYTPIIGKEQVDYMLDRFQSRTAVKKQIEAGMFYFLIEEKGEFIGYLAFEPREDHLFLSKIYVKTSQRSRGYGRQAVRFAEERAREQGFGKIVLTVNKNNVVAIRAYERMGFRNVASLVQDIGGGFVMDDYRMEKELPHEKHREGFSPQDPSR